MLKPKPIVRQVYKEHISKFGEPSCSLRYDNPPHYDDEVYPSFIDVMVWNADEEVDITTFVTIGMSEKKMKGADYRAELHFSIEGKLKQSSIDKITIFMANVALYPFMNSTHFDWWHTLPNVNKIPEFKSGCGLLLHPAFVEDGWDVICTEESHVKIMNLVPLTKYECDIAAEKGIDCLLDYLVENEVNYFKPR